MSDDRAFDRALEAWLADGSDRTSPQTRAAVLLAVKSTPQERDLRIPRRFTRMSTTTRYAAVAAVMAVLAVGAFALVRPVPGPGASAPPGSPTPASSATPPTPSSGALLAPMGYGGGGTIEFTKHDAAGGDVLWLIDPSGANATKVLDGACCGLFSPDGRQLALAAKGVPAKIAPRDPSLEGIEVLDRPGTSVAFEVPTNCGACEVLGLNYEPDAWSPDGRYIALTMWSDTDPSKAGMGLADRDFSIPWDWSQTRATGVGVDIPVAFSPDSRQLLFMREAHRVGPTSNGPLFVLTVDDLSVRQISQAAVTVSANGIQQGPASWSPDGRTIVFAGSTSRATSIFSVVAAPASDVMTLIDDATGASSARFSPDGSLIAFDRRSAGPMHDLYVMHPDGSGLTNLTADFGPGVCCAQWSPDGRAMLVSGTDSDDDHSNLFIVAADGSGIWQVTNETNVYTGFLWGPDFR